MKRKKILVAATLAATALAGSFAFAAHTNAASGWLSILSVPQTTQNVLNNKSLQKTFATLSTLLSSTVAKPTVASPPTTIQETPDWVNYYFLFQFAGEMKKEAHQAELEGKDASEYKQFFVKRAALDDIQNQSLQEIANSCLTEVDQIDALAQTIIDRQRAFLETLPPPVAGAPLPDAPPELLELQAKRDAVVVKHIDLLKAQFGDSKFNEFDAYVKKEIAPNVKNGKEEK